MTGRYDVAVEASSKESGLRAAMRALRPGGICTAPGYYLAPGTKAPVMDMYATTSTWGSRASARCCRSSWSSSPRSGFPAEQVTSQVADWEDAPTAYAERSDQARPRRDPLDLGG